MHRLKVVRFSSGDTTRPPGAVWIATALLCFSLGAAGTATAQPVTAGPNGGAEPQLTGIGFLPGAKRSAASAVSADGSVAVGYASRSEAIHGTNAWVATRWSEETGLVALGGLVDDERASAADDVSGDGSVVIGGVGGSELSEFRWTHPKAVRWLQFPFGSTSIYTAAISADAQVIAGGAILPGEERFLLWNAFGNYRRFGLPSPLSPHTPVVSGVSGDGSFVALTNENHEPVIYDVLLEAMTKLERLPGAESAQIEGISADGRFAVGEEVVDARSHPVVWGLGSVWDISAGELPSLQSGTVYAISDDASLVVGSYGQAVLWTGGDGIVPLAEYLEDFGLDLSGWRLISARDVSADGRTIVGHGQHEGYSEGWVVHLPPACSDRLDNDGDGFVDELDPECDGPDDHDESDTGYDSDGDEVPDPFDNCPGTPNSDQTNTDGDPLGDVCDPFPTEADNEFAQCVADVGECREDLFLCTVDGMACYSDLSLCTEDLEATANDLAQTQADLEACLAAPPPDADGDGETDGTDACDDTPANAGVDQAGCSQDQFCEGIQVQGFRDAVACVRADWKNDEPIALPGDCRIRTNGMGFFAPLYCESTAP